MHRRLQGKARDYERKAQQIRRFARVPNHARLDPFILAEQLGFKICAKPEELRTQLTLTPESAYHLLVRQPEQWSGGVSFAQAFDPQPTIYLNPTHRPTRQVATLMEEICHLLLGHAPSQLQVQDKAPNRTYRTQIEDEAYGIGAAALVPAQNLLARCEAGESLHQLARHYGVSSSLIEYRLRLLREAL